MKSEDENPDKFVYDLCKICECANVFVEYQDTKAGYLCGSGRGDDFCKPLNISHIYMNEDLNALPKPAGSRRSIAAEFQICKYALLRQALG